MNVRIDMGGVMDKIEAMTKLAIFAATNQALTDLNQYVPFDTGTLMGSSLSHSVVTDGHIEWVTPYAMVLWRGTRKGRALRIRKTHHPKATKRWTLVGKQNHVEQWRRIAEKAMGGRT